MDVDAVVVGAGVIGLACAAELARTHRVIVLERHSAAGRETSSRNSEVIHAGIYYPEKSLKALCCVEGRDALYDRCERLNIPYRRLGKYIVATRDEELPILESLRAKALANGADVGEIVDGAALQRAEPLVRARAALWSPLTGIVDAHALVSSYQAELESRNGEVALRTHATGLDLEGSGWRVTTRGPDGETARVTTRTVINAAGLDADRVAGLAGLDVEALGYRQYPCKGDYFAVAPSRGVLCRHLVYPLPVPGGLGIHVTLDLAGRARLGPDVEYVATARYDVDPSKGPAFAESVRRYLPSLRDEDVTPDFAGVRPKLAGPGVAFRDYVIEEASAHGAPGLWNLVGIESPGLTASSAIARRVAGEIRARI